MLNRGVIVSVNGITLNFDGNMGDYNFISHAHSDHIFSKGRNIIASDETISLASQKFKKPSFERAETVPFEVSQIDNGHILGSRAFLINSDSKILYTGDFSIRDRYFMKGFKPSKADILIIESTFGKPEYVFPSFNETMKEAKDFVEDTIKNGSKVSLLGYSLGKAQILSKFAEKIGSVGASDEIRQFNNIYRNFGIDLKPFESNENCDIFLAQSLSKALKNSVKIGFSGWAVESQYNFSNRIDKSFVISDHADFYDLVKTVKSVSPDKVFIQHGFSAEFSSFLRAEGFEAVPLSRKQNNLFNYH